MAVGYGSVWVSTRDGVLSVDPTSLAVSDPIPLGHDGCAFDLTVGGGSIWATDDCEGGVELARIDPETRNVEARIPIEGVYCVDAGEGAVWATASAYGRGRVVRIDPVTNEIRATISIEGDTGVGCLAVGADGVWVSRGGSKDSLVRIDPTNNQIATIIDIPNRDYWNELVVLAGTVWVASWGPVVDLADGTRTNTVEVLRIDPRTNAVIGEPIQVGHGMFGVGVGEGSVWVYHGFSPDLSRIDPKSGRIIETVPILDGGTSWGGSPAIVAADGVVWIAGEQTLNRVELVGEGEDSQGP